MMNAYHKIGLLALALALPFCNSNPEPISCTTAQAMACGNFVPGSFPVCFDGIAPEPEHEGQGAFPAAGCSSGIVGNRFGAPDPKTDGMGGWDWWCCVAPEIVIPDAGEMADGGQDACAPPMPGCVGGQ